MIKKLVCGTEKFEDKSIIKGTWQKIQIVRKNNVKIQLINDIKTNQNLVNDYFITSVPAVAIIIRIFKIIICSGVFTKKSEPK